MKKFVGRILAFIGGLVVLAILAGIGVAYWFGERVPDKTILELDFEQGLGEYVPDDPIGRVLQPRMLTTRDVVEALEKAAEDKRVVGLIARVGTGNLGLAQVQEVRDTILSFRSKGKFAVAYAETFGEFGPGNGAYYLATSFDTLYLQPSGEVGLTGLMYETPFLRGTLEKLGIVPRLDHRKEYKNAMNTFTERQYTPPHREAVQQVMD